MKRDIDSAIAAHGMWKSRLRQAITTGKSDVTVATATSDKECPFGKWLHGGITPDDKSNPHFQKCSKMHAEFHSAAGKVLGLALSGKKSEAEKALGIGSEFSKISAALTSEMTAWSAESKN